MTFHLDVISGVITLILTIAVVGGASLAVLRSGYLKQNNEDLTSRVKILEDEQLRDRAEIAADKVEISALKSKVSTLETVVTGRDLLSVAIEGIARIEGLLHERAH